MPEEKHQDSVPFDNRFHRQLADVRNSSLNQNHPDIALLNGEHQRNLRYQRDRTVLDSLTGIPAIGAEPLTQPTVESQLCKPKPKKVEYVKAIMLSFSEVTDLLQTLTSGQLALCVVSFPELLKVRITLGEDTLIAMKVSLAEHLVQMINVTGCVVGDYVDNKLIVMIPGVTKTKAETLLAQVQVKLSEEYVYSNHARIRTVAQVGVTNFEPDRDWRELIEKADLAVCSTTKKKGLSFIGVLGWLQQRFCTKKAG